MNDFDRLKVGIYEILFAEESRRDQAVDRALARVNRGDIDRTEAAAEYIVSLAMRTEFDLLQRRLFDILRRG
jgi:hypothetical protein